MLILTRDAAIRYRNAVTVAPITTTIRGVSSEVFLAVDDGLPRDCAANFHNLQTGPKQQLEAWITTLAPQRMADAERALQFALGLDPT